MAAFVSTPLALPSAPVRPLKRACATPRRLRTSPSPARKSLISASASHPTAETQSPIRYDDDGTRVVPVALFLRGTAGESVAGVYAVLDAHKQVSYVGMSSNVAHSLRLHLDNYGQHAVAFVRVMTFRLAQAQQMKLVVDTWIHENETLPKGNEDNWMEADQQLAEEASLLPNVVQQTDDTIVSPFASSDVQISAPAQILDLTMENVDSVLDEVRPYLISDGGNVAVVSVDSQTGDVQLQLNGACSSCASATVTMQMGIEKTLREKFGSNLGQVIAVASEEDAPPDLSVQSCEAALDEVQDALRGLGATVSILEIDDGEVIVSFTGPNNVKYGVEMILRDKIPGVTAVTFE